MSECAHTKLALIRPSVVEKVRCQRCHLTIAQTDLDRGAGHCPECFEVSGKKHRAFEKVELEQNQAVKIRCEDCGLFL